MTVRAVVTGRRGERSDCHGVDWRPARRHEPPGERRHVTVSSHRESHGERRRRRLLPPPAGLPCGEHEPGLVSPSSVAHHSERWTEVESDALTGRCAGGWDSIDRRGQVSRVRRAGSPVVVLPGQQDVARRRAQAQAQAQDVRAAAASSTRLLRQPTGQRHGEGESYLPSRRHPPYPHRTHRPPTASAPPASVEGGSIEQEQPWVQAQQPQVQGPPSWAQK